MSNMFHLQNFDSKKRGLTTPADFLRQIARRSLLLLLVLGLSSCAGGRFERAWKQGQGQTAQDLTGSWEGKWLSHSNGHTGRLRCIVSRVNGSRDDYAFQYQASWGKFLRGIFTIQCKALRTGPQRWKVSGSKDLGPLLGGEFSHQAEITPQAVHAEYHSQLDHGVMELKRPGNGEISTKSTTPAR